MIEDVPADFVDLVQCFTERASGRAKDLADVETLEEIRARQRGRP